MSEIHEWYCEVCKKYSFKRKDKHFRTENHKIKQSRLDRKEAYEDYMIRRYYILMENTRLRPFSKYLEKSALFYKKLKKDFELFYKDEYIHHDSDSESDSDSDSNSDSDDEDTEYEDYVKSRYDVLMKNDEYMRLSKYLERRARVYKLIKKEFKRTSQSDLKINI